MIRNTTLSADALWPPLIHALVELAREYRAKVTRREDDDLAMLISALQLRDDRGQLQLQPQLGRSRKCTLG